MRSDSEDTPAGRAQRAMEARTRDMPVAAEGGCPTSGAAGACSICGAVGVYLLTRVVVFAVALFAPQDRTQPGPDWWSPCPLMRWDAGHYVGIAIAGYPPQINDTTAFFPAYPLIARPLTWVMNDDWAMIVVANVLSLAGVIAFFVWCRELTSPRVALAATALFSTYPHAFILSAGYAEGLFILGTAAALLLVHRGYEWPAALVCGVLSATRPNGVVLSFVMLLLCLPRWRSLPIGKRAIRFATLGVLSVSGLLLHQLHLWRHYGRPDAFLAAQATWSAAPTTNIERLTRALTWKPVIEPALRPFKYAARGEFAKLALPTTWNALLNLLVLGVAIAGLLRPGPIPRPLFLIPILTFLMAWLPDPVDGLRLYGVARYQLAALPCFLWLAQRLDPSRRPIAFWVIAADGLLLEGFFTHAYCDWREVS